MQPCPVCSLHSLGPAAVSLLTCSFPDVPGSPGLLVFADALPSAWHSLPLLICLAKARHVLWPLKGYFLWEVTPALLGRFRHPFSCESFVFCPCSPYSIYHTVWSLQVCFLVRLWILLLFYWSIIDLQCCLSFWHTAKWLSYTYLHAYTYSFSFSFPLWFITGFWIHSLCCTVGPCCLCILNIVVFIC